MRFCHITCLILSSSLVLGCTESPNANDSELSDATDIENLGEVSKEANDAANVPPLEESIEHAVTLIEEEKYRDFFETFLPPAN